MKILVIILIGLFAVGCSSTPTHVATTPKAICLPSAISATDLMVAPLGVIQITILGEDGNERPVIVVRYSHSPYPFDVVWFKETPIMIDLAPHEESTPMLYNPSLVTPQQKLRTQPTSGCTWRRAIPSDKQV